MSETEQKMHSLLFALPEDQDAYNAAVEGKQLREIIESLDNYLSIFKNPWRGHGMYLLHRRNFRNSP